MKEPIKSTSKIHQNLKLLNILGIKKVYTFKSQLTNLVN